MDIISCPKPTVALAGGHALGGGLGIALACDLCLACEDVHFSTPEIQVGLFPMMVMALLYRNIGRKKATELMFLGERISATEALHYGIVNHVYARERFHAESGEFIRKLVGKNPTILAMGKRAMSRVMDQTLAKEEELLESALVDVLDSEESKKIMQSFLEKRKAKE
jgi:enoyl-CoA hydratase/carnithine racemase